MPVGLSRLQHVRVTSNFADDIGARRDFAECHLKCRGEPEQVGQAGIALTALDAADIGAVEAGEVRETLLGDPSFASNLAERKSISDVRGRAGFSHLVYRASLRLKEYGL